MPNLELWGADMDIEHEDIKYDIKDDKISAYLSKPADEGRHPGVVLIHEIFGLDGHIRNVADRLASEGYVVVAPDLFSSRQLSETLTPKSIGETMKFIMSMPVDKQRNEAYRMSELEKMDEGVRKAIIGAYDTLFVKRPTGLITEYLSYAVDYLKHLDSVNGKIGSVGFCFGGGMSINLACTGKTEASVIFYGENPDPIDKIKNVKGAVMGLYGGEDSRINSGVGELVRALISFKKGFIVKVYPGAHHAFFNDTRQAHFNKAAADDAWKMLLQFYRDNL